MAAQRSLEPLVEVRILRGQSSRKSSHDDDLRLLLFPASSRSRGSADEPFSIERMSRFAPGFFASVYGETPPWDIGAAQPDLLALLDAHPPASPVLDAGCGSGDLAVALAARGLRVLGIDVVEAAIAQARAKADALPAEAAHRLECRVADALRPARLRRRFGAVVDSGFFHVLETEERDRFVGELAATLAPGGRYYLLAFAVEFDVPNTPLEVTEDELRARFTAGAGWRIAAIRPARFLSRFAPVPSLAACIERAGAGGA
jgi:SAM-dependent methyltransferase